jgi:hypothetical protein
LSRFTKLWEVEGEKLSRGEVTPAKMLDGATDPVDFCISTIARLVIQPAGEETISNIRQTLSQLFEASSTQFIYPDDSLHISLVGCTQRESESDVFNDDQIRKIESICKSAIESHKFVDIVLKGIGIIGNQIFIQGVPLTRDWEETRASVTTQLEEAGEHPISYPDKSPIHINIIRITDTSDEKLQLLHKLISQLRDVDLGIVRLVTVELVITDFTVSKNNLTLLSTIPLQVEDEA